jgi:response regulator RpfG family c-di-GMP phosphodiesterase
MSQRILCVDDDPNILAGLQRTLRRQFTVDVALGGEQALAAIDEHGPYAVIVVDMRMPGIDGIELLQRVRVRTPDTIRIMLTGNADQKTAIEAVNQGHVYQFLTKPCPPNALTDALEKGLAQYRVVAAERELLENTLNGAIKLLTDILSLSDPQSFGRGQILKDYVRHFSGTFEYPSLWELELAGMLSPIGCVSVPDAINQKVRSGFGLSGDERDVLARVPKIGAELLENIPRLGGVARIVLYQSKHFDGSGFPVDAVSGLNIPLGARILKVLSDLVQLEAKKIPKFRALEQMQQRLGWYDPAILAAACACFNADLPGLTRVGKITRAVGWQELRAGQTLHSDVRTVEEVLIVTAGTRITPVLMERLKNFAQIGGLKEPIEIEDPL